jgi:pilus assembly protein CpaE
MPATDRELTALVIAPDQELVRELERAMPHQRTFQSLAWLKAYPSSQTLEIRLRQLKPDVVLLDLASDLDAACAIIPRVCSFRPAVQVIGLHRENHPEAVVRSLQMGATEFLHAPFEANAQLAALARIRRLQRPEQAEAPAAAGKAIVFCSAKRGSGSSTLALYVAHAIQAQTRGRVLLADFDLQRGAIGSSLGIDTNLSTGEILGSSVDSPDWSSLAVPSGSVDVIPSPEFPGIDPADPARLRETLEQARLVYDTVVLDMPVIFQKLSLLAVSEADYTFLVATPELANLHLARRAVAMLTGLGFNKDRFQVIVNRMTKREAINSADLEKILAFPVKGIVPNESSLPRIDAGTGGRTSGSGDFGKAVNELAGQVTGVATGQRPCGSGARAMRLALAAV